ncbi:hypothetical protein MKQ68_20845 [Chitinophaga horti]|uniref:Alpha/beta hydrolase n=1 Tax=Chitinophaga horti TaxID=2920382 RepID=A0ABY6IYT6_9BACT|nr:hypothetical protein [Chitinophaga horti]UYQ92535.1 hypothetical protein MKQ68_20845 [Chitinophaga horti]
MRTILFLLMLVASSAVSAQSIDFNSAAAWSQFHFHTGNEVTVSADDTCLVFVTNRHLSPDSLRFVDEFVDTTSLKYFFLEKQEGKWNVYQEATLGEAMQRLPIKRDVVLYAEGMGKIFTANVMRAQLMSAQYNVNVVMFDYASINTTYKPSKNFRFARENASLSARQYYNLLLQFQQARKLEAPWLTGVHFTTFNHSMGNIIVREMMQTQDVQPLNDYPFIDNLVLNAACVPQKGHADWVNKMRFARHVYIHHNRKDFQLKGAHLITMKKQLGEKIRGEKAVNATYVNFHDAVRYKHSYFMNFPQKDYRIPTELVGYFSRLLRGEEITSTAAASQLVIVKEKDKTLSSTRL